MSPKPWVFRKKYFTPEPLNGNHPLSFSTIFQPRLNFSRRISLFAARKRIGNQRFFHFPGNFSRRRGRYLSLNMSTATSETVMKRIPKTRPLVLFSSEKKQKNMVQVIDQTAKLMSKRRYLFAIGFRMRYKTPAAAFAAAVFIIL